MKLKKTLSKALAGALGLGLAVMVGLGAANAAKRGLPRITRSSIQGMYTGVLQDLSVTGTLVNCSAVSRFTSEVCALHVTRLIWLLSAISKLSVIPKTRSRRLRANTRSPTDRMSMAKCLSVQAFPLTVFPAPYANSNEAAALNNGAAPPDFSLLAKARAPERGFPTFVFDIFTAYAENGPDYIYSLLTGYQDAPEGVEVADDSHYNPYFIGGNALAMANPLSDDIVDYDDGYTADSRPVCQGCLLRS